MRRWWLPLLLASALPAQHGDLLGGLFSKNPTVRTASAVALRPHVDQVLPQLLKIVRGEDARALVDGMADDMDFIGNWHTAVGVGTGDGVATELTRLLPRAGYRLAYPTRPTWNNTACPDRDRAMVLPWGTRELVVQLLGRSTRDRARVAKALIEHVPKDRYHPVDQQIARSLLRLGDPGRAALIHLARKTDLWSHVGDGLHSLGDAGQKRLAAFLADESVTARTMAVAYLDLKWLRRQPAAVDALVDVFFRGEEQLSKSAANRLMLLEGMAVPRLVAALDDDKSSPRMRRRAVALLSEIPDHTAPAVDALLERARSKQADIRCFALRALGNPKLQRADARRVANRLARRIGALEKPDNATLLGGLLAIGRIGHPLVGDNLNLVRELTSQGFPRVVQHCALVALQGMERLDHLSIHDVEHLLWGPNDKTKDLALDALVLHGDRALPSIRKALTALSWFRTAPDRRELLDKIAARGAEAFPGIREWLTEKKGWLRVAAVRSLETGMGFEQIERVLGGVDASRDAKLRLVVAEIRLRLAKRPRPPVNLSAEEQRLVSEFEKRNPGLSLKPKPLDVALTQAKDGWVTDAKRFAEHVNNDAAVRASLFMPIVDGGPKRRAALQLLRERRAPFADLVRVLWHDLEKRPDDRQRIRVMELIARLTPKADATRANADRLARAVKPKEFRFNGDAVQAVLRLSERVPER